MSQEEDNQDDVDDGGDDYKSCMMVFVVEDEGDND